jgi:flagellar biosynthesis/type III secretory pathway M-ring protein FliF/YscJ
MVGTKIDRITFAAFEEMLRLTKIILIVLFLMIVGGLVFVMTWDIPPNSKPVEKVIEAGRFPK